MKTLSPIIMSDGIKYAAKGELNLLYPMKAALLANATLGEISDALRKEWGIYRATEIW